MADRALNTLFLCIGNSARSIMAEAIMNRVGGGKFTAYSAGSMPKGQVHPGPLEILKRNAFRPEDFRSKGCEPGLPVAAAATRRHRQYRRPPGPGALTMRDVGELTASLEPPPYAFTMSRRLVGEALGTALLLAIVIGSGIMGERLAGGNVAIALLGNTLSTGAGLVVLITLFGPLSGAHFNPAVTLVFAMRREIGWAQAAGYVLAQTFGGILGVWAAHAMFAEPIWQVSTKLRDGPAQVFAEFVATFGLIAAILGAIRFRPDATPLIVGLYITSAYWFTASTSFANPAVTIARSLSNTFAGIAPSSAPMFIFAQLAGAVTASLLFGWLLKEQTTS